MALNRMKGEAGSCWASVREVLMTWVCATGVGKMRLEADNTLGGAGMKKAWEREGRSRGMTEKYSALDETRGGVAAGEVVSCSLWAGATRAEPVVGAATAGARCTMAGARDVMAGNLRESK